MPDIIETIQILAIYEKYANANKGDESTENLLTNMICDILDISPDKLSELCDYHKKEIEIINL